MKLTFSEFDWRSNIWAEFTVKENMNSLWDGIIPETVMVVTNIALQTLKSYAKFKMLLTERNVCVIFSKIEFGDESFSFA